LISVNIPKYNNRIKGDMMKCETNPEDGLKQQKLVTECGINK
jgi:hypothetical protein